jgi:hypothetical protein
VHEFATQRTFLSGHAGTLARSWPSGNLDKPGPPSYRTNVPHSCFADEIAIDFPAVGRVVDGIRDAFLGEAAARDVVAADVSVSRREAAGGHVVHLALPVHGTCPACGGRGESWTEVCVSCDGTGTSLFNHPVRLALPAGVADGATFRFRLTSPQTGPVRVEVRVAVQPSLV